MNKSTSIIAATISAIFLASLVGACSGENPEKLVASGKEFLAKNDGKAAIIQLKNALQQNPNLAEARFLLGKAMLASGDPAGAEVELRKALELEYSPDQATPLLARALITTGQARKLTDEFANTNLAASESQADLKLAVSRAYAMQDNKAAAQAALAAAIATKPDYPPVRLADARSKATVGNFNDALIIVDKVLTDNSSDNEALLLSGELQAAKGNRDAAMAQYRKAKEAKPESLEARTAIITTLLQQQKNDDATSEMEALKKILPKHPQTIYLDAQVKYQRKDYKGAHDLTQQLLKMSPNNTNSLQLAGAVEYQLRSYIQAETYLTKALQQNPNLGLARNLLISNYLRIGQPGKALNILEPVLPRIENDVAFLTLAGETFLQNGNANRAAEYFGKASKLDPNDPSKKTALALAHLAQGSATEAFGELEQISLGDKGTTADLALIAAYLRYDQFDKALKTIEALEKKQPDNPGTYNLRARTLLSKKDVSGARKSFEKALSINPAFFPAAAGLAALDMQEKKPDNARKRFDAVLATDPKNVEAMLALASLRANNGGTPEEVSGLIGKAVSANPGDAGPRLALIQFHLSSKDTKRALTAANDAAAAFPDNPEILDALGRTQQLSGDLNQALNTYAKLAGLQPASPRPLLRLAEINVANKNKDEAEKDLNRALSIQPDLVDAQRGLILLALEGKDVGKALAVARQAQKQRPAESIGYILEGDIHASQKTWAEAINAYRTGQKHSADPDLAVKLYSSILATGNPPEAEKFSLSWLKEHPKDLKFRMFLGDIASNRKDFAAAVQYYGSTLELQPNNPLILNNLAWAYGQLKSPKAVEYAQKANQLAPNQPPFMDTLAMLLAESGDTAQAIELLRKAIAINPVPDIKLNLAKVLISAGKKDEARKELEMLAKMGEKFPGQAEVTRLQKQL